VIHITKKEKNRKEITWPLILPIVAGIIVLKATFLGILYSTTLLFNSTNVFSITVTPYITTVKYKKYKTVLIWPNSIKGDSTCLAANCIKIKKFATNTKKAPLLKGLHCIPLDLLTSVLGNNNKIRIAENMAITPKSLLGIDLNIA